MRSVVSLLLFAAFACTTAPPPPPAVATAPPNGGDYGITVQEEGRILALEDRREYDAAVVAEWTRHPNALHRQRIALALGRIGPHSFVDSNGDGDLDSNEMRAGVAELGTLVSDADRRVRETAVFALGEIGDRAATETLFALVRDSDGGVAAEAVEALSKLAGPKEFAATALPRYLALIDDSIPEGVRARAVRFLFRFDDDRASAAAQRALSSESSAIRQEGAYALFRRPYAPAREQLELVMTDPNVLTRAYATTALGRIGHRSSMPLLITALGDVHPWVRTNAAVAIARLAERDRSVISAGALPRIFAALEDPDPGARASIVDALGHYAAVNETARTRLLQVLRNGPQWDRELAAGAIARHFAPDSETFASLGTLTPWQTVRVIEATAGTPHGAEIRQRYAGSSEALVRAKAIGAIPDERVDAELTLIRAALDDDDVVVRANAYDRYSHATTEPAEARVAFLREAEVRERNAAMNDARLAAISAAARIEFPQRDSWLRSFLGDSDTVVRRVASDLLVEHLDAPRPRYTPLPVTRSAAEYEEIVRWSQQPHTATIHMTRGDVQLALLTQQAPMTTWNFAQLAKKGFYDDTTFMRVVPNFVIQGGDPRNDMSGGPGYAIRDEINLQKYTRGAVGMALSGPDTGGSQFFITHSPQPHLDGGYTIFARVYDGMSGVVDQTERGDRVRTISIDERPPVGTAEIESVPNVSLPLEVGMMPAGRLVERVPDYGDRKSAYNPDITVIEMMKSYVQGTDRVEVYMGTWCHDSQREVPKFLRILDDLESQFGVMLPAAFVALDRSKQKPEALVAGKEIGKVATFIYYRGERELGRIVERPIGLFEDDLLALAASDGGR